jgi:hypothetical protein
MKRLLMVTAIIELMAGAALMVSPSAMLALLLGSGLETSASVALGRLAGAALLALGVACWLGRYDVQKRAARGLVNAMVIYNFAAVVILASAGIGSRLFGIALWLAIVLHAAMALWCIACLRIKRGM